jgi:hypothetical protein
MQARCQQQALQVTRTSVGRRAQKKRKMMSRECQAGRRRQFVPVASVACDREATSTHAAQGERLTRRTMSENVEMSGKK